MADDTKETGPSEVEILQAQLEIAETKIIEQKATIAGLQAENTELVALIKDNTSAQKVLSTAAAALSSEIDEIQNSMDVVPSGLSSVETAAIQAARQAQIDKLVEKSDNCKKYIRGDL